MSLMQLPIVVHVREVGLLVLYIAVLRFSSGTPVSSSFKTALSLVAVA